MAGGRLFMNFPIEENARGGHVHETNRVGKEKAGQRGHRQQQQQDRAIPACSSFSSSASSSPVRFRLSIFPHSFLLLFSRFACFTNVTFGVLFLCLCILRCSCTPRARGCVRALTCCETFASLAAARWVAATFIEKFETARARFLPSVSRLAIN